MFRFNIILGCSLLVFSALGQVDSFLALSRTSVNDSVKIHYIHAAAQHMHSDTSLLLLHQCLRLTKSKNNLYWKAKLNQTLAKKCDQINGDIDSLRIYSERARDGFLKLNMPIEVARSIMQIGMAQMTVGNRIVAMSNLTEAARLFEQEEAFSVLAPVYINISYALQQSGEEESQLEYLLKAYTITTKSGDLRNRAISAMGIQSSLIDLGKLDSAKLFADEAFDIAKRMKDPILMRYAALNLGKLALHSHDTVLAEHFYLKMLTPELGGHERARALYWIAMFYDDTHQKRLAQQYFVQAESLATSIGANELRMNILIRLREVLKDQKKYQLAIEASDRYITLADSFHSSEIRTSIKELTIIYESEKKERENQALALNLKNQELKIFHLNSKVKQQILMVVLSVVGVCTMLLFYFLSKKNQTQKNQIANQKNALQEQKIRDLETEQMLLSIKSLVRGQEEERSRIAKELHDGLGSIMSSLKLAISQLPDYGERLDYQEQVQHALILSDHANVELRRIAQNLMPETLTRFGLIAALEDFIAEINFSKIVNIQFQYYYTDQTLPNDLSLSIYRIIQELLQNAIKHAESKEILVQLMKHGDLINITVEDDGIGFDNLLQSNGSGFKNIESRLAFFNGNMRIESVKGEGSTIFIECPIAHEKINAHDAVE